MKWDKEVKEEVKMYQASDYEVSEETPTYILMKKNTATGLGHFLVFIVVGWFTLGLANLVYHLTSKKTKKVMK